MQIDLGSVAARSTASCSSRAPTARTPDGPDPELPGRLHAARPRRPRPRRRHVVKTVTDQPNPPGPGPRATRCRSSRKPFDGDEGGRRRAPVRRRPRRLRGDGQRQDRSPTPCSTPASPTRCASVEYGTYDVTEPGQGRRQHARRRARQRADERLPAGQRRDRSHRRLHQVQLASRCPQGTLTAAVAAGDTTVTLSSVTGYAVGDTVNVDTGDGGSRLESRKVTAIDGNVADRRAAPSTRRTRGGRRRARLRARRHGQMAVSPRLLARLEVTYADGTTDIDRQRPVVAATRTARPSPTTGTPAPTSTPALVQPGWDEPGADLSDDEGWADSSITSAAVARHQARVARGAAGARAEDVQVTQAAIKQIGAGLVVLRPRPELRRHAAAQPPAGAVPAGTVIRMTPGESRGGNGMVSTASAGSATGILNTYTTSGAAGGETFAPQFMYHGFQYVQVDGLPGRLHARRRTPSSVWRPTPTCPRAARVTTDNELINTVHRCRSGRSAPTCSRSSPTARTARSSAGWPT